MKLLTCECGCGKTAYYNQLVEVVVEQAVDKTLRQTEEKQRFLVLRACKKPFEEELGYMTLLLIIANKWAPTRKTWAQKLNVLRTFDLWVMRIGQARQVMRLQHATYERTKGFEYARKRAWRSAVMFGCPRFIQGFVARQFLRKMKREAKYEKWRREDIRDAAAAREAKT